MIEILPAVDIIDGKCVRLTRGDFASRRTYDAQPQDMARRFVDAGMNRIHAVDLDGARLGKPVSLKVLESMAMVDGTTIEWGGGMKTTDDLKSAINAGARYLVSGSIAAKKPELFADWIESLGHDTMVLGADTKDGKIAVAGWLDTADTTVDDLFKLFLPHGLTQAIVTEISRDGMLAGPDFGLYQRLLEDYPTIIVTVSGGISSMDDIKRLADAGLQRVIVGKALYEGHVTLKELENYIANQS